MYTMAMPALAQAARRRAKRRSTSSRAEARSSARRARARGSVARRGRARSRRAAARRARARRRAVGRGRCFVAPAGSIASARAPRSPALRALDEHAEPARARCRARRSPSTVRCGQSAQLLVDHRDAARARVERDRAARYGAPSSSSVPASGRSAPASTFISVLLPAPFSPSSACTSPARDARDRRRRARSSRRTRLRCRAPKRAATAVTSRATASRSGASSASISGSSRFARSTTSARRCRCAARPFARAGARPSSCTAR